MRHPPAAPLALLLVLALLACAAPAAAERVAAPMPVATPRPTPAPGAAPTPPPLDAFADAVLLGDSLADGLVIHDAAPDLLVLARIGLSPRTARTDTSFRHNDRPVTAVRKLAALAPDAVYLWLGTNGLDSGGFTVEGILADYERLAAALAGALPDTALVLLEITPVAAAVDAKGEFTNARVDAFNEGLHGMALRHGAYVLPINAPLRDAGGCLHADYAASDGMHLRAAAYQVISDLLYNR